jgi:hypothetical protein
MPQAHFPRWFHLLAIANDQLNFTQQFATHEGRVSSGHSVASTQNLILNVVFRQHAMNKKAVSASEQRNLPSGNLAEIRWANHDGVSWPDSGQHAPPVHLQPKGPKKAETIT